GGASLQFSMVPFNLMKNNNGKAAYLETGVWAKKAIKEAKRLGEVVIPASSSDKNFNYIPKDYTVPEDVDYFHCTSNNTIYGTQMKSFPERSEERRVGKECRDGCFQFMLVNRCVSSAR